MKTRSPVCLSTLVVALACALVPSGNYQRSRPQEHRPLRARSIN